MRDNPSAAILRISLSSSFKAAIRGSTVRGSFIDLNTWTIFLRTSTSLSCMAVERASIARGLFISFRIITALIFTFKLPSFRASMTASIIRESLMRLYKFCKAINDSNRTLLFPSFNMEMSGSIAGLPIWLKADDAAPPGVLL